MSERDPEAHPREDPTLAPYAARAAQTRGRASPEGAHPYRTEYQRDRDRIVHAAAFRRLEHKTQVFQSTEGDHYRTRLTHTLEATQIARTLARALGLNEDLTEAISLAHDLGHAPFGHAGEEALKELMAAHGGFDHNRQALRVVDILERRAPTERGLNLTYEVREALVKHGRDPSTRTPGEGARLVPELAHFHPDEAPLLEAQLVDQCDSVAYDAHDLDDGLRSGLLHLEDARRLALWRRAEEAALARHPDGLALAPGAPGGSGASAASTARGSYSSDDDVFRRLVIRRMIDLAATDLLAGSQERLAQGSIASVADVRAAPGYLIRPTGAIRAERAEMQAFLFRELYRHHRVMRIWRVAKQALCRLFEAYTEEPLLLPPRWRAHADEVGVHRAACDYLAGMTDRYAAREAGRLALPGAADGLGA